MAQTVRDLLLVTVGEFDVKRFDLALKRMRSSLLATLLIAVSCRALLSLVSKLGGPGSAAICYWGSATCI
jgi:hypothetical protein